MPYLIGTDEAGYAPNLGPLLIVATAWRVPRHPRKCDLYEMLRDVVVRSACKASESAVAIADSKAIYKSGQGVRMLERGVLSALASLLPPMASARQLFSALDAKMCDEFDLIPWHANRDVALPAAETTEVLARCSEILRRGMAAAQVELVAVRACAVFPAKFNALSDALGSKGEALSRLTLGLIGDLMEICDDAPALVICDKHGGRGKYQRLLQSQFPDPLVEVVREGLMESIYRWGPVKRRVEVCFRAEGENFLPAALASMTAKYLRELAMRFFNEFWCEHVDGLRPTAGYPSDARRFKMDIATAQTALGIDDELLWRRR